MTNPDFMEVLSNHAQTALQRSGSLQVIFEAFDCKFAAKETTKTLHSAMC